MSTFSSVTDSQNFIPWPIGGFPSSRMTAAHGGRVNRSVIDSSKSILPNGGDYMYSPSCSKINRSAIGGGSPSSTNVKRRSTLLFSAKSMRQSSTAQTIH